MRGQQRIISALVFNLSSITHGSAHIRRFEFSLPFIMTADRNLTSKNNVDDILKIEKKDAKFWNMIADHYSKSPISDEASYQKKLEITRTYLDPRITKVLEFGCGTGSTALIHAPYAKNIHAIDVSSKMIDIAKGKAEEEGISNVDFEVKGIDRLEVPDETYDVVLGLSILHLLPNKDEVIAKTHRMLKPDGVFISSTSCIRDMGGPLVSGLFKAIGPVGNFFGILPKLNLFTSDQLKDSLTQAGFVIETEFHPGKDKACFLVAKKKKLSDKE